MVANEYEYRESNAAPYYTNSSHLPVDYTDDVFELMDLQDDLQTKYTGGTVVHLFIGEEIKDVAAMKSLVKNVCENYRLPYFTITPTFSVCPKDGYMAGKVEKCKKCGSETEVYSRIVGYIRPVKQWNPGKRSEFSDRETYSIDKSLKNHAEVSKEEVGVEQAVLV
ncbi:MAG: anaerobic ribonucleoside triphosphate reductase [bacterium ADurb.Bin400]|nr:MAG: anaerobic ribonucleoside triphosphate reductase [bacterium ADurb.Bin400]